MGSGYASRGLGSEKYSRWFSKTGVQRIFMAIMYVFAAYLYLVRYHA